MKNNLPNINLRTISQVTELLCRAGAKIKQQDNEREVIRKEKIIRVKEKIDMLESKYKLLKKKHKNNAKLNELNIYFSSIKKKLGRINI